MPPHLPMFHQLEALVVGESISMADLKGTLSTVWKRFFGDNARMRPTSRLLPVR